MRIAHQFAPPMSAMLAGLPGITTATHIPQEDRWALIDLDSMCQHRSVGSFAPAYARDRARFMRNWPESSALYQVIDQRLPKEISNTI